MLSLLLSLTLASTPADEVRRALADVVLLAEEERATTRYATLYNVPKGEREVTAAVVGYLLNAVSHSATIVRPAEVEKGPRLLRFDLRWYGLSAEQWEDLIRDEPYFRAAAPAAGEDNGYADGGWIDSEQAATLRQLCHSQGPIVRADWLVSRISVPPAYYDLAGVAETRGQWYADLGVDPRQVVELKANHGANILRSGVTRQVRRVSRWQGTLGGVWQTYDVSGSGPGKDPFRDPTFDGRGFNFEAGEMIAAKSNGLHLFALYDAAGRRQDAVPDRIAKDDSDPLGDGIIVPLLSCVRCHVEDGLRPVQNDQRTLLSRGVDLYAKSPDLAQRLAEFYGGPHLDRDIVRDRQDYAAAVQRACGLTPAELSASLAGVYREYVYELVTPDMAARGVGTAAEELPRLFRASHDPVLLSLAVGLSVQREQWIAAFAETAVLAAE
ncbi:MAG: hypothetical protein AB7O62_22945 [Pirellulales bacterium]